MPHDSRIVTEAAEFAAALDPLDVIRSFDIDSDVPLRQGLASGLLRMAASMRTDERSPSAQVIDLGTFWCEIVHADVEYRLDDGLRLVARSEALAEALTDALADRTARQGEGADGDTPTVTDLAYVLARWNDGAGKIRYRTTAYSRAARDFKTAVELATAHGLWWLLPDVTSNHLRARFEELRQGLTKTSDRYRALLADLIAGLEGAQQHARQVAVEHEVKLNAPVDAVRRREDDPEDVEALRALEFLRGWSSLLHNYSVAVNDDDQRDAADRIASSREVSRRAAAVSTGLGDEYRLLQALQQQAFLAEEEAVLAHAAGRTEEESERRDEARRLLDEVIRGRWRRGELIARQRQARLPAGAAEQAADLKDLLDHELNPQRGSATGADLDIRAWTVRFYADAARRTAAQADADALEHEIQSYELRSVRAVRQVLALPMYKRGYADLVRPVYTNAATLELTRAGARLDTASDGPSEISKAQQQGLDAAFAYAEESSARELLDMLSARSLPRLGRPPSRVGEDTMAALRSEARSAAQEQDGGVRRRGTSTVAVGASVDRLTTVMAERAEEFEATLQRNPLEISPHDPEISHRVMMLVANNPGTALVRYVLTGKGEDTRISAFVAHGRRLQFVPGPLRSDVSRLAGTLLISRAPDELEADGLWRLLLKDVWTVLDHGTGIDHLVVVPTDEVFALPLHAACPRRAGARPLGVRVAMSYSVSATAYVSRGRHLLRRLAVDADDDLAAVVGVDAADPSVTGGELRASGWRPERLAILGEPPLGAPTVAALRDLSWDGMQQIEARKPEFFVYIGHGGYTSAHAELGPYLMLPGDVMTQFDVALRLRLPRNKLTVLGACVAAQGMASGGGEVAGFVRSLMAAGAGAIALPLWSARDDALVHTVGALLGASRVAADGAGLFDVVESLRTINAEAWARAADSDQPFEWLPLALYL